MEIDDVRRRMDEMTDDELRQYQRLCAVFGYSGAGGEVE